MPRSRTVPYRTELAAPVLLELPVRQAAKSNTNALDISPQTGLCSIRCGEGRHVPLRRRVGISYPSFVTAEGGPHQGPKTAEQNATAMYENRMCKLKSVYCVCHRSASFASSFPPCRRSRAERRLPSGRKNAAPVKPTPPILYRPGKDSHANSTNSQSIRHDWRDPDLLLRGRG